MNMITKSTLLEKQVKSELLLLSFGALENLEKITSGLTEPYNISLLTSPNVSEILTYVEQKSVDMLIIEAAAYTTKIHNIIKAIFEHDYLIVAVFVEKCRPDYVTQAIETGVGALIVNGLSEHRIERVIHLAKARHAMIKTYQEKLEGLKLELDNRKDIERAKGLLMEKRNISEKEAYDTIRRLSMAKGKPMREIAIALLDYSDILS